MKKSVLLSLLAALILLFATANAYSQATGNFHTNGVNAYATACINNCAGGTALVTLLSSQSNGQATWFVYFDIYGNDSQGHLTDINSVGQIPASMVSGNGKTSLTLNLDTHAAGLDVEYCVADAFLNYTCTPYAGGVMNVTWTPTNTFTLSGSYVNQMTTGPTTVQMTDHGSSSSATVQANVFGQQYADAGSQLGTDHVGQVTVSHK